MSLADLLGLLHRVEEMQAEGMFILTGFYLDAEAIEELRPEMAVDEPRVGAIGRFDRVPVYPMSRFGESSDGDNVERFRMFATVGFSYVRMDVVN